MPWHHQPEGRLSDLFATMCSMTTSTVAGVPPVHVLDAMATGRWALSWTDTKVRPKLGLRYRWMLNSRRGSALLIEGDQSGRRCEHSTLAPHDGSKTLVFHTDAELDRVIREY